MSDIGKPIPKGFIDSAGVHAAQFQNDEADEFSAVVAQIDALRADVVAARAKLASVSRTIGRSVQAHPLVTTVLLSAGLWVFLGWGCRRMKR